ncbi:MAG: hypothetical protein IPN95_21785 [Bacteroidetes bacterium]|nr:hypothetical protein [Bacteroidota bacterium]
MQNLTLATATANKDKGQRTPFEVGHGVGVVNDYETIKQRLQPWRDRLEYLQKQIDGKKKGIRGAKGAGDIDGYNRHVKDRWVLRFERDYWRNKIERFELEEISSSFVRRQLVDTQVITKYATGWLKTVFKIVRGTKGSLTDELRHLWELQKDFEAKDRTNHTHHLIDAIVNAFIEPGLYNRLAAAYREAEQGKTKKTKLEKPWPSFVEDVRQLCDQTLVYHVYRDRLNVQSKFKYRDRNGHVHYKTGQGVKAPLHKETALGNVRSWEQKDGETVWKRNDEGGFERIYATRKDVVDKSTKAIAKPHFPLMVDYISARKDEYKAGGNQRVLPVYKLRLKDGKRARILGLTEADLENLKENDLNAHFLNEVAASSLEEVQANGFFLPVKKVRVATRASEPPMVRQVQKAFQKSQST